MSEQISDIEKKLIEFATKTAETIQTQAGQIQAISHVLLIAMVSLSEQQESFKSDFVDRISQINDQLSDRPIDNFTREYFEELIRFLDDPYNYSVENDNRPTWLKGIIAGGKQSEQAPGDKTDD